MPLSSVAVSGYSSSICHFPYVLIRAGSAIFKAVASSGTRTLVGGERLWADKVAARNSAQIAFLMWLNVRLPHHRIQLTKTGLLASLRSPFALQWGFERCGDFFINYSQYAAYSSSFTRTSFISLISVITIA
jgi:hypothetical protein